MGRGTTFLLGCTLGFLALPLIAGGLIVALMARGVATVVLFGGLTILAVLFGL